MSKYEQEIRTIVNLRGTVSVVELAKLLNVTDQTIRRIVKPMEEQGDLKKIHGALVSTQNLMDPPFLSRMNKNRSAKVAIANCIADLVEDGSSLAIDTGSTSGFVAQALRRKKKPEHRHELGLCGQHPVDDRREPCVHGGNPAAKS
jgi:DeoR family transcriptional regulator, glycerol-3-phosphate regulon repressor